MNMEKLEQAVKLSEALRHVFVATADESGMPHIAAAGKIKLAHGATVEVSSWFCPLTVDNLQVNKHVNLVVWDSKTDNGYQLIGESVKVEDLHMLNGYAADLEGKAPLPQVERKLTVKIISIIDFKHAPHTDSDK